MTPNKRIEFARRARPTRNGEAPLLAAHSRRYAFQRNGNEVVAIG